MQNADNYAERMKTIQIRNVPDDVHRELKVRAALDGRSLSDFALAELRAPRPVRAPRSSNAPAHARDEAVDFGRPRSSDRCGRS